MLDAIAAVLGVMLISFIFDGLKWLVIPGKPEKKSKEDAQNFLKNLQAAELGNSDAQYKTGHAYSTGTGIQKDYQEAYFWYRLAASSGTEYFDMPEDIAKFLTPYQIAAIEKRLSVWKPKSN